MGSALELKREKLKQSEFNGLPPVGLSGYLAAGDWTYIPLGYGARQNRYFSANWMLRGLLDWPLISPNVPGALMARAGGLNMVMFARL